MLMEEDSNTTGANSSANEGAGQSGAAYVFSRNGTSWSQQAYLKASNSGANHRFGYSVGIFGDVLVAGAPGENSSTTGVNSTPAGNAAFSGAAYVFDRAGSTWSQRAYLKASNTGESDNFGRSVAVSADTVAIGAPNEASSTMGVNGASNEDSQQVGAAYTFVNVAPPEISIEHSGLAISSGGSKDFGGIAPSGTSAIDLTIRNTGGSDLTLTGTPKVSVTGSSDFSVTIQPASPITGPSGSSNFTVRFSPTGSGLKSASLSIPNNDADENPFVIHLIGTALSFNTDSDGDGMNDASEFNMAALGFNWQVSQPSLVSTYQNNANGAGYYSLSQVQALNSGTPLIQRNPTTGKFKLTMDWKKSTNLTTFTDFPAPAGSAVSINPQGNVEFEFPSADDAAFFRIEVE